jgi:hypothetical protein
MSADRRQSPRQRVDLLFNKYNDGYPHLCRILDVSEGGLLLERVNEPKVDREFYPVEIGLLEPDNVESPKRVWLWAKQVWSDDGRQALRFVGIEEREKAQLRDMLARAA